jgi:hypothetical protein
MADEFSSVEAIRSAKAQIHRGKLGGVRATPFDCLQHRRLLTAAAAFIK